MRRQSSCIAPSQLTFLKPPTPQAYLEFFISPKQLNKLIAQIEADPQITYHAVNASGDMRTNTTSEAPNAVTWGCFPHKEIVQPTIVESISFLAWKDEAYEIGRNWARVYDEKSPSRKMLDRIFGEREDGDDDHDDDDASGWWLVNVVYNDFKQPPDAIFKPFLAAADPDAVAAATAALAKSAVGDVAGSVARAGSAVVDGVKSAVNGLVNGSGKGDGTKQSDVNGVPAAAASSSSS